MKQSSAANSPRRSRREHDKLRTEAAGQKQVLEQKLCTEANGRADLLDQQFLAAATLDHAHRRLNAVRDAIIKTTEAIEWGKYHRDNVEAARGEHMSRRYRLESAEASRLLGEAQAAFQVARQAVLDE